MVKETYRLLVGTWNVGETRNPGNLASWFLDQALGDSPPDLVMVGLQEVDMSAEAYLYAGSLKESFWDQTILINLARAFPDATFKRVTSRLYVGIYGGVFIRDSLLPYVSHTSTSFAACGLMGLVGNKGAVGIRFRLHSDYICFISSHLAAHIPAVQRRNQDVAEIVKRSLFNCIPPSTSHLKTIQRMMVDHRAKPGPANLNDSSLVVWAGDLNYRVPMESVVFRKILDMNGTSDLLARDQLNIERTQGRVLLKDYHEAPINFQPTFKYDPGSNHYDTSEKNRTPAWCDRILFKSSDNSAASLSYDSVQSILVSDHKPVRSVLTFSVDKIVANSFSDVYAEVMSQLDQFENELIPMTQLQKHQIDTGQLVFRRLVTDTIEILNVGQVVGQFSIIPKPGNDSLCNPWIRIRPMHGILLPGESREIRFFFYVDSNTIGDVQSEQLEDIVIVHVDGGRDHFISISGSFRRTSFCVPLEQLPMHQMPYDWGDPSARLVPVPIWILVDFIRNNGQGVEGMFIINGDHHHINSIQDALDAGSTIPDDCKSPVGVLSACQQLLRFLDSLPDSVIPRKFCKDCTIFSEDPKSAKVLIEAMPKVHRDSFEFICDFLKSFVLPQDKSTEPIELAYAFGPVMIKSIDRKELTSDVLRKLALFILQFLK